MNILHQGFAHPLSFVLLALLPALGVAALLAWRRQRRVLARFGTRPVVRTLAITRSRLGGLRGSLWVSGLLLLIAGIAGPRWGRDWEESAAPGRDLVLVLDLSRSMLAQDVLPNRAERAKQALRDLAYTVQQRGGHRLALVAFAARARIVCPLTHDYDHLRAALEDLDANHLPRDLRPTGKEAVSGTRIGAGLHAAVEAHDHRFRGSQDILLISDGDDPARDGEWREGMALARRHHIPVHTVGVGDPDVGSPITVRGTEVLTRLEEQPLEAIARLTDGKYIPARTNDLRLGELFLDYIEPGTPHEETDDVLPVYRPHYPWFIGAAFVVLSLQMIMGQWWSWPVRRARKSTGSL
jgi:Ca-activated chloride channel family protein